MTNLGFQKDSGQKESRKRKSCMHPWLTLEACWRAVYALLIHHCYQRNAHVAWHIWFSGHVTCCWEEPWLLLHQGLSASKSCSTEWTRNPRLTHPLQLEKARARKQRSLQAAPRDSEAAQMMPWPMKNDLDTALPGVTGEKSKTGTHSTH